MKHTPATKALMEATAAEARRQLDRIDPDPDAAAHVSQLIAGMGWQCVIDGCQRESRAVAMCEAHYRQFHKPGPKCCLECNEPIKRRENETRLQVQNRRYCSRACASKAGNRAKHEERQATLLEDFEWIAGTDSPDRIAQRLGYRDADNLARIFYKWGRNDLAARLFGKDVAA